MLISKCIAPFNCDSVEINNDQSKVFVGMYQYEASTTLRGGGYQVYNNQGDLLASCPQNFGCLDAKWVTDNVVVSACSDGILRWIEVDDNRLVQEVAIVPNPSSSDTENIIMTVDAVSDLTVSITAKGRLTVIKDRTLILSSWEAHSPVVESWACDISPDGRVIASGADDCTLRFWDARTTDIIHNDSKNHSMGTTCIEFLSETLVLSGSYDEKIRKFDMRNLSFPVDEVKTVGGVWRLKHCEGLLFVAACYGGCQIFNPVTLTPVLQEYRGHDSMAYGIDYLGDNKVVSCSFYDRSVQFWTYPTPT